MYLPDLQAFVIYGLKCGFKCFMGADFFVVNGVNAVRCEIDERDAIYVTGLDSGEGESFGCTRYIDVERGEFVVSAEIIGISDDGRALLRELSKETK